MKIEFNRDIYFSNSIGIFQGGGCSAIAHIGAYESACEHGVLFYEVAGTSAGSIIASLIALGASPGDLKEFIQNLEYDRLLIATESEAPKWKTRIFDFFSRKIFKKYLPEDLYNLIEPYLISSLFRKLNNHLGIFDSEALTVVLNEWYKKLSGISDPKFRDLPIELHVVSSDTSNHRLKVWDRAKTPDESVANAVTSSCCIPLFFTPYKRSFADGCLICNRPDFIAENNPEYHHALSFIIETKNNTNDSLAKYLNNLWNTMILGADEMQHQRVRFSEIKLPGDKMFALDFSKLRDSQIVNEVIADGKIAMDLFFNQEIEGMNNSIVPHVHLSSEEQLLSQIAFWSNDKINDITVQSADLEWVWELFPSIVRWADSQLNLMVYYDDFNAQKCKSNLRQRFMEDGKSAEEVADKVNRAIIRQESQIRLLKAIGAKVIANDIPTKISGFYFKIGKLYKGITYTKNKDKFDGKVYGEEIDSFAIESQIERLNNTNNSALKKFKIRKIEDEVIIDKLRYHTIYSDASFSWEDVELKSLRFIKKRI